ncbi:peptidase S41 [Brevundimonas sp. GCM10030266]|uniref:peptidase S41 n=1 Tax=Brevundimonas sp. GCM10030266 TaxID=3273386 RepID=UPI0036069A6B
MALTRTVFSAAALCMIFFAPARAQEAANPSMSAERDWSVTLARDAKAVHDIIAENHPGMHDTLNPGFRAKVDNGLAVALHRAETTTDAGGWWWALRSYVASFDDGHMQVGMTDGSYGFPARWPGFLTIYRGADQVVADRLTDDPSTPPLGARLIDCDGVAADRLAETRIGEFRGRWFLESQRAQLGDWLFLNGSNPWIAEMGECRFERNGQTRSYALNWRSIETADLSARRRRLSPRASSEFGLKTMDDGGLWLSMPSFDSEPGSDAYVALTNLLAEAQTKQDVLRKAPWVVLDLRGNGGGSSHWSDHLATLLWGSDWRRTHDLPSSDAVDWRASDDNIAEIVSFIDQLKAGGGDADLITWGDKAITGMRAAKAAGQDYWREDDGAPTATPEAPAHTAPAPVNPMQGRVFVLTDSGCGSACLDAVDIWKAAGAVQIGRETAADTVYMEVRNAALPSGLAGIGVPMKVYRGRARGNNEPQRPAHEFDGAMNDTAALQAWIQTLIPPR